MTATSELNDSVGSKGRVYLDYAATSPLDPRVLDEMMPYLTAGFGNANALYEEGKSAQRALEESRKRIASRVGCRDPYELVFTSGGTESDNAAILGLAGPARDKMRKSLGSGHIICSEFEHKAVLQTVLHMKSLGYDVSMVSPRADGFVHPDDLEELIRPDTLLVSIMTANNEIGTVQPISELAEVCHDHSVIFHTDAVAAVGKMRFDIRRLGVDSASFTAHKICGPKGIGALYLNKRHPFTPLVNGGGQERGRRSGTSDVPGAVGFAKAVELAIGDDLDDVLASFAKRRDRLIGRLLGSGLPIYTPVEIPTGDTEHHLPQLVPLLVDGMESEEMVRLLDERGFSVSGGSACTTGQAQTSHVLRSIGCDDRLASGFLRVTFGRFTTDEELDAFADALCEIVSGGISGRRQ